MIYKTCFCYYCQGYKKACLLLSKKEKSFYCSKCKSVLDYEKLNKDEYEMSLIDIKQTLVEALQSYPEFLKSKHLVELGLYSSLQAYSVAKKKNKLPPCINKDDTRLLFPKSALINWITEKCIE